MPGISVVQQNFLLDAAFGDDHAPNIPDSWWLCLFDGDPFATGVEVTADDNGYERVELDNDDVFFPSASNGQKRLAVVQEWEATDDWDRPVVFWGLAAGESDTQMRWRGRLSRRAGNPVQAGAVVRIRANSITIGVR